MEIKIGYEQMVGVQELLGLKKILEGESLILSEGNMSIVDRKGKLKNVSTRYLNGGQESWFIQ